VYVPKLTGRTWSCSAVCLISTDLPGRIPFSIFKRPRSAESPRGVERVRRHRCLRDLQPGLARYPWSSPRSIRPPPARRDHSVTVTGPNLRLPRRQPRRLHEGQRVRPHQGHWDSMRVSLVPAGSPVPPVSVSFAQNRFAVDSSGLTGIMRSGRNHHSCLQRPGRLSLRPVSRSRISRSEPALV
jgi:hypothetical protein